MNKLAIVLTTGLLFSPLQTALASQAEDQELCIQQFITACMQQCEKTKLIDDCSTACQQQAQNQCLYAGE